MTLRLLLEFLNPIDMVLLVGKSFRMVNPEVTEVRHSLVRHDRETVA
jgi:hypothetical protein